jgi:hypothetical protein
MADGSLLQPGILAVRGSDLYCLIHWSSLIERPVVGPYFLPHNVNNTRTAKLFPPSRVFYSSGISRVRLLADLGKACAVVDEMRARLEGPNTQTEAGRSRSSYSGFRSTPTGPYSPSTNLAIRIAKQASPDRQQRDIVSEPRLASEGLEVFHALLD